MTTKKKLLFVIPSLDAGGAEKALVNLLNELDYNRYEVDLFLYSRSGLFLQQVPSQVNVLSHQNDLQFFQQPLLQSVFGFLRRGRCEAAVRRIRFFLSTKAEKNTNRAEQHSWKFLRKYVQISDKHYDAAIGFLEKTSIYTVVDCVKATRKIGVIHTYYSKLNADVQFDEKYFSTLNSIAGVSPKCIEDLQTVFPKFTSKMMVLSNIVSASLIHTMAAESDFQLKANPIVSIGRLVPLKGFDLAIEAANLLKEKGVSFHWYIIGEGSERTALETMIEKYGLQDCFFLLGLRSNPYPYIQQSKVFVQCSRFEGKSIAIDEAKILAKPIVLTNFTTAKDQIERNINGIICEMTPEAIAESISTYLDHPQFTQHIVENLQKENFGTEHEIEKLYQLINE